MALFRYLALNEKGRTIKGAVEAESLSSAKDLLLKQKVIVTRFIDKGHYTSKERLGAKEVLSLTREISQLLRSGLSLYDTLQSLKERRRSSKGKDLLSDILDQLKSGQSLSSALNRHAEIFDPIYLATVSVGEATGSLAKVFAQLTDRLEREQKMKQRLIAAISYPAFLGVFCLILIFGLLFFVIPSMQELFEGRPLHPLTQFVLDLSVGLHTYGWLLLSFVTVFGVGGFFLKRYLLAFMQKIPLLKTLYLHASLIRFLRGTALLHSRGISLLEAIKLARSSVRYLPLRLSIEKAEEKLIEGKSLSSIWAKESAVPPLVLRMIAVGEESGKMAEVLGHLAEIYHDEMERELSQLTTYLQPLLLLTLGLIIGLVLLSVLLPMTDVSSFLN